MKNLLIIFLTLFSPVALKACDICNLYVGISPNDYQNTIGLFYRSRMLKGFALQAIKSLSSIPKKYLGHIAVQNNIAGKRVRELYTVYELRGNYFFNEKTNLTVAIPFINNYQSIAGETNANIYGIGDPLLLLKHQSSGTESDNNSWTHRITIGGSIKHPLGKTNQLYQNKTI